MRMEKLEELRNVNKPGKLSRARTICFPGFCFYLYIGAGFLGRIVVY